MRIYIHTHTYVCICGFRILFIVQYLLSVSYGNGGNSDDDNVVTLGKLINLNFLRCKMELLICRMLSVLPGK